MSNKDKREMSFWDHLSELLKSFRIVIYALIISTIVIMMVPFSLDFTNINSLNIFDNTIASRVINDLQERFLTESVELIPLNFYAPLEVYFFISFVIGTIISLPIASYELYKFFSPALTKYEKGFAVKFVAVFICLFAFGFVLGYLYIVPLSFGVMLSFSNLLNLTPTYNFADFFSLIGLMLLVCGLLFTFPVYIYMLVRASILETQVLTKNRRYLYGGILIIIAIVDPDPSLITEGLTFIPIVILMEISIFVSKRVEKSRKKKQ
jgi:sec-independent protein translocase protein TatC